MCNEGKEEQVKRLGPLFVMGGPVGAAMTSRTFFLFFSFLFLLSLTLDHLDRYSPTEPFLFFDCFYNIFATASFGAGGGDRIIDEDKFFL